MKKTICIARGGTGKSRRDCLACKQERAFDEESTEDAIPHELDAITDAVLAYRPKPKSKGAKRRTRRAKKAAKDADDG